MLSYSCIYWIAGCNTKLAATDELHDTFAQDCHLLDVQSRVFVFKSGDIICETVVCGRNVSQLRNRHKSKKWIHKCRLHIHMNYICFQISEIYLQISKIYIQMPVYLYTFYRLFVCRVFVFVFCV